MPRKNATSDAANVAGGDAPTPLEVLQRFRVLIRTAQRHSQWIERQSGITGAQLWALQELFERPGLRVGELGNLMALHQSTVSNMVDRLETSGLVRKERTAVDQRVVRLYLTDRGGELLAGAPSPARGVLPEALCTLDGSDLRQLQRSLDQLLRQIKKMDEGFGMQPLPFTE
ncbi:MarR family winged helix-turn-helix transcriptional regulator [Pseudazoarcus pumilus]|uniref:MarR family transcriptional regulator n=1 Tax=Pseudazoarcus pumilus TaxID=2067960 RepID=A0A2I6S6U8_9RHOO|nr:MarR family winged helix-turn-helix transcriptional regulator [Pseudazoarcus pumilus]AUN94951.1 MarR family transcriptional regulator [Pseudazoarcus pumilus]